MCSIHDRLRPDPPPHATSALGDRRELLGRPVALAPEPGGPQVIGEASGAAEAFGVRAGMRLGEALSRCPALTLVAPDPVRAEAVWEHSLRALESIGARVEPSRPGEAFFAAAALRGLYGEVEQVLGRGGPGQALRGAARRAAWGPGRTGSARERRRRGCGPAAPRSWSPEVRRGDCSPSSRSTRCGTGSATSGPAPGPRHPAPTRGADPGRARRLPAEAIADRFGEPGLRALRLARGADEPLRPRSPHDEIDCRLGLPEAASGQQLEHALGLLVERLLAHPARAERTIRRLRIEARLAGAGGGWRSRSSCAAPAPTPSGCCWRSVRASANFPARPVAGTAGARARSRGRRTGAARALAGRRAARAVAEAVRQVRSAAGRDAVLRVLEIDPRSRVPERRAMLAPFSDRDG